MPSTLRGLPPRAVVPTRDEGEGWEDYIHRRLRFWAELMAVQEMARQVRTKDDPEDAEFFGGLVPPTEQRAQHDPIEVSEKTVADVEGAIGRPWRMVDSLERMWRRRTISDEMFAAGRDFRGCFDAAQLHAIRAIDAGRIPGSGKPPEIANNVVRARQRLGDALDALGGAACTTASAAWFVLGVGETVKEWSVRQRWGRSRSMTEGEAATVVRIALEQLVSHYARLEGRAA